VHHAALKSEEELPCLTGGDLVATKHLSNPANQMTTRWKEISIASIKLDINQSAGSMVM